MTDHTETAAHLSAIRRTLTVVTEDRPTPEQIAEWNTADKEMAQKVRAVLPGVPLHHAYAVLQAARTFQRLDTAAAAVPAGQAPATGSGRAAEAELYVLLRKAGEDRY
ncbi:hypothetical protein ACIPMW_32290 [Streptomyces sp. NPDC086669]|uniref:hypothetical protein n=1 Tax=Streptomyces sp. NPDC086669 TaxID=3365753 RepID=UPI00383095CA